MPHGSTAADSADTGTANPEDPQSFQTQGSSPRFELSWTISLFGTAVGAGVLFLPINAGLGGIWP